MTTERPRASPEGSGGAGERERGRSGATEREPGG